MAWIESHQTLGHHPKTLRLATELKCGVPGAIGYVHLLWYWALDFATNGEIRTSPSVLARACEWRGNPERFVHALVTAGFLEDRGDAGIAIHDWLDYAGRLVAKRAANAERMRSARASHVQRTEDARAEHVQGLPYPTVPDHTVPDLPDPTPPTPPSHRAKGGGDDFEFACCPNFATTGRHWNQCPQAVPA
jgi:hypothetical protein